ncbi:MAG: QueT transporter family protein [Acholeplasmataceae bacterium]
MKVKITLKELTTEVIIAAIYVILVFTFYFLSFEAIQFRIAEILLILVFYHKRHLLGLLIGTFIANYLGVFGIIDALFGTLATLITLGLLIVLKRQWLIALLIIPPLINGLVISFEISLIYSIWNEYFINFILVFLGEFLVMLLFAVPVKYFIDKSPYLLELLKN